LNTCQSATITWTNINISSSLLDTPLVFFLSQNDGVDFNFNNFILGNASLGSGSWTWPQVNAPAGSDYTILLFPPAPFTGPGAFTSVFTVVDGSDTSCVGETSFPDISHMNLGAIVGGVIGGVVFIALLAFLALFLRKRQNKRRSFARMPDATRLSTPVRPPSPARSEATIIIGENNGRLDKLDPAGTA
jgi:hypothetical protein